jgi:hypothetical protein
MDILKFVDKHPKLKKFLINKKFDIVAEQVFFWSLGWTLVLSTISICLFLFGGVPFKPADLWSFINFGILLSLLVSRYYLFSTMGFKGKKFILSFHSFRTTVEIKKEHYDNYFFENYANLYHNQVASLTDLENRFGAMMDSFEKKIVDWCDKNCKGIFYYRFNEVYFSNKKDAILFKLRWG